MLWISFLFLLPWAEDTTVCRPCTEHDPNCAFPGNADQPFCDHCAEATGDDTFCPDGYCDCTTYDKNGRPTIKYPDKVCRACTADDEGCLVGIATDTWCSGQCAEDAVGGQCFKEYCVCETCDKQLMLKTKDGQSNYGGCAGTYKKTAMDHCGVEEFYSDAQNMILRYFSKNEGGSSFYADKWYCSPGSGYSDTCSVVSGAFHRSTNTGNDVDKSLWTSYTVEDIQNTCDKQELPSQGASRSANSAKEGDTTVCRPCEEGDDNCAYPGNADQAFCDRCAANGGQCPSGYCDCQSFNPDGKPSVTYPTEVCRACTSDDEGCLVGIATDTWCAGQCAPDAVGGQCFKEYCVCETCDSTLSLVAGSGDYASCAGDYRKTDEKCDLGVYYSDSQNRVLRHFPADETAYGSWPKDKWYIAPGSQYTGDCSYGISYFHYSTNRGSDVAMSDWSQYEVKDFVSSCPARELPSETGSSRSTHSTSSTSTSSSSSGPDHAIDQEYHLKEIDTDVEWSKEETWERKEMRRKRAEAERAVSGGCSGLDCAMRNFMAADETSGTSMFVKGFAVMGLTWIVYGAFQFYCSSSPKGFSAIP